MALESECRRHADTPSLVLPSLTVPKFFPICAERQEPVGSLWQSLFIELLEGEALGPRTDRVTHGNWIPASVTKYVGMTRVRITATYFQACLAPHWQMSFPLICLTYLRKLQREVWESLWTWKTGMAHLDLSPHIQRQSRKQSPPRPHSFPAIQGILMRGCDISESPKKGSSSSASVLYTETELDSFSNHRLNCSDKALTGPSDSRGSPILLENCHCKV